MEPNLFQDLANNLEHISIYSWIPICIRSHLETSVVFHIKTSCLQISMVQLILIVCTISDGFFNIYSPLGILELAI